MINKCANHTIKKYLDLDPTTHLVFEDGRFEGDETESDDIPVSKSLFSSLSTMLIALAYKATTVSATAQGQKIYRAGSSKQHSPRSKTRGDGTQRKDKGHPHPATHEASVDFACT